MNKYMSLRIYCTSAQNVSIPKSIRIPNKIFRTELTVLKTLSNSVKVIQGVPPLFHPDDPEMLNTQNYLFRKMMYKSRLSGKNAAKLTFSMLGHEFLNVSQEEPKVQSLFPLLNVENIRENVESSNLSVNEGLIKIVHLLNPDKAWEFYIENTSFEFSDTALLELLELLCATNGGTRILEDQYFETISENKSEWHSSNSAEIIFRRLGTRTRSAYVSMIKGCGKFLYSKRALYLYEEMKEIYQVDLETYNYLFRSFGDQQLKDELLEPLIIKLLCDMKDCGIYPNKSTFRNLLSGLRMKKMGTLAIKIWNEMKYLNIEPDLGIYANFIKAVNEKSVRLKIIEEVMDLLEKRQNANQFEDIENNDDFSLLSIIMIDVFNFKNFDMALRIHNLYCGGGRYFLFDSDKYRSQFIDQLIKLTIFCKYDVKKSIDILHTYVPQYYSIQASSIYHIFNNLVSSKDIDLENKIMLLTRLFNLVNWSEKLISETDLFERILDFWLKSPDILRENGQLNRKLEHCLRKLLNFTKQRENNILTKYEKTKKTVELIIILADDELLWDYMTFFVDMNNLTVRLVQYSLSYFAKANKYDYILKMTEIFEEFCSDTNLNNLRPVIVRSELLQLIDEYQNVYSVMFSEEGFSSTIFDSFIKHMKILAKNLEAIDDLNSSVSKKNVEKFLSNKV